MTKFIFKENSSNVEKYKKVYCVNNVHLSELYQTQSSSFFNIALLYWDGKKCDSS
jgi:hypothetical protein